MRISDWSSDVCSSDLLCFYSADASAVPGPFHQPRGRARGRRPLLSRFWDVVRGRVADGGILTWKPSITCCSASAKCLPAVTCFTFSQAQRSAHGSACCRSEEHTSELQSLMRTSYAVFCL